MQISFSTAFFPTVPVILLALLICSACSSSTDSDVLTDEPQPRGERILAIDVNTAEGESYEDVVARAGEVGATTFSLSIQWDELETSPGTYEPAVDLLGISNDYYPARGLSIALMIGPIDTHTGRLPADLEGRAWDDTAVVNRYRRLLDHVFSKIPDLDLAVLAIGNEVDATLGADAAAWAAYKRFYDQVAAHARDLRPGLKVGVKITADGLLGPMKDAARALNQQSDVVLTTYYPLNSDFTMKPPSVVGDVFDELVSIYPAQSVWFMELGYATSPACNSSEGQQAQFIEESFRAWDVHRHQVGYVSFSIMSDRSPEEVEGFGRYYGISDPAFLEYLRTLGLRTYANGGSHKKGWIQLKQEAAARGW